MLRNRSVAIRMKDSLLKILVWLWCLRWEKLDQKFSLKLSFLSFLNRWGCFGNCLKSAVVPLLLYRHFFYFPTPCFLTSGYLLPMVPFFPFFLFSSDASSKHVPLTPRILWLLLLHDLTGSVSTHLPNHGVNSRWIHIQLCMCLPKQQPLPTLKTSLYLLLKQ